MNPFARLYAFWLGIPSAMREPIAATFTASTLTCNTVLGLVFAFMWGQHAFDNGWTSLIKWIEANWLAAIAGAVYGATVSSSKRVQQAQNKVANTITLDDGRTAQLLPTPKQP